jgi:hypothetical protein
MRNHIEDALRQTDEVTISVIAVSLRNTWRFLEEAVPKMLGNVPQGKRINLNLGMVDAATLEKHQLHAWKKIGEMVKREVKEFIQDLGSESRIGITLFTYQNLPHWHGLLINSSELFMGRTRWTREVGGSWQLSVGQEPYRLYSANKPGGLERIRMFISWFDWYYSCGSRVENSRTNEAFTDESPPRV